MYINSTPFTLDINLRMGNKIKVNVIILIEVFLAVFGFFSGYRKYGHNSFSAVITWVVFGLFIAVLPFVFSKMFKNSISKNIKKSPILQGDVVNRYVFQDDKFEVITSRDGEEIGTSTLKYSDITKITGYLEDIYLYINITQAYVLNSSGMTEGTFDGLKQFLADKCALKIKTRRY